MAEEPVSLTIDGRQIAVPRGTLLVEAARLVGIEVPVFCYHPKLKPVGACRMCLVEIEKMPRLQTACTTPAADGMVVRSASPGALAAQSGVLELLLANHPLDCPICDKGGECPLQDNTFKYGPGISRMVEEKRHQDKAFPLSERIVLDKERCIMCFRCVRFQQEIAGDEALAVIDRGAGSEIGTLTGEPFDSPFSGNTIELCPVGALTSRQYRFRARPWDLKRTRSVCVGCAVGCNVELHSRDGRILRMLAADNPEVDDGWLCDYGRFDTLPSLSGRPTRPLVRRDGNLVPATWDEALARAAQLLTRGRTGALGSTSLTNEAIWAFTFWFRKFLPGERIAFWPQPVSSPWIAAGTMASLANSKRILLAGIDPWSGLPVLALWLRKAIVSGGKLVVVGPKNGLYRDTAVWLRVPTEQIGLTLRGLVLAFHGRPVGKQIREAADVLTGEGPATLLGGAQVDCDQMLKELLDEIADHMGVDVATGMAGCPTLLANGRGVSELTGSLSGLSPDYGQCGPLTEPPDALLLVGPGNPWPPLRGAKLVLATYGPLDSFEHYEAIEVLLPLAHPYEQTGSLTNFEGRVQELRAGGIAPPMALPDWAVMAKLANALGAQVPDDIEAIRAAMVTQNQRYAVAFEGGLPEWGRFIGPRPRAEL